MDYSSKKRGDYHKIISIIGNVSERNEKECKLRIRTRNDFSLGRIVVNESIIIVRKVC